MQQQAPKIIPIVMRIHSKSYNINRFCEGIKHAKLVLPSIMLTSTINPINGLMDLSWWLQKGMTIVCSSYVIGHKFIKPTDECGVQYPPDINPICG